MSTIEQGDFLISALMVLVDKLGGEVTVTEEDLNQTMNDDRGLVIRVTDDGALYLGVQKYGNDDDPDNT